MEIILLWFGLAIVTALIASSKGRNPIGWFLLAVVISGLLALILVALLPSLKPTVVHIAPAEPRLNPEDAKSCPRCAETVKKAAKVCRYCNYEFTIEEIKEANEQPLFDKSVFIRRYKPAMSAHRVFETNIHGTKRRFTTEDEAREHIWRFRNQRTASHVFPMEPDRNTPPLARQMKQH